jgi:P27 family predicted phage terminase small subunit
MGGSGSGGQNKKPERQHKDNGTHRPGLHSSPRLPVEAPAMPPDITGKAQAAWNILSRQLVEMGVVAAVDMVALRLLCESIRVYMEADDEVQKYGITYMEETKAGEKRVQNPACRVRNSAWAQVTTMLRQFGLTPASRTGMAFDQAENDEEQEVANILKMA